MAAAAPILVQAKLEVCVCAPANRVDRSPCWRDLLATRAAR